MKITDLRTRIVHLGFRNCVLVTVETDAGITGISETVMKRRTFTIEQSILQLRRYLIGKDPTEIEDHWEKMYRDSFWVGGAMHATAISAVDCALWDMLAKSLGRPRLQTARRSHSAASSRLLPLPRRRDSRRVCSESESVQGAWLSLG